MKKRQQGKLNPAPSSARYPTLQQSKTLDRRAFLVGLGAAAAVTGLQACEFTSTEGVAELPQPDASSGIMVPDAEYAPDASPSPDASSGIMAPDAAYPPDAGALPDASEHLAGAPALEDAGPSTPDAAEPLDGEPAVEDAGWPPPGGGKVEP